MLGSLTLLFIVPEGLWLAYPLLLLYQKLAQCFHAWHCTAVHHTTLISTKRKVSVTTALFANTGVLGKILTR